MSAIRPVVFAAVVCLGLLICAASLARPAQAAACVGDCNESAYVDLPELITGIHIALGDFPLSSCPAFDANGDAEVSIEELLQGVENVLDGCGPHFVSDQ
jgi:hypothetical protein